MSRKSVRVLALMLAVFGVPAAGWASETGADAIGSGGLALTPQQTAQVAAGPAESGQASAGAGVSHDLNGYFGHWFARVDAAQASQPHWVTPIATVTPRLEEEVRYDQFWQHQGNGASIDNFDGGKGLELIPTTTNEIILNVPPYEQRSNVKPVSGFGDDPVLLIKQRLLSANEENGNYILTAFLSVQAPIGITALTNDSWLITPTIAGGKGFGDFDVQGTFGVSLPVEHEQTIGYAFATNVAFQYHVAEYFWPEFEVNDTFWSGGERDGKNQVMLTPGVILGRFALGGRLKGNVGVGYQFAVSPTLIKDPLTPTFNHEWILTARVSF
jgi:hypothetical protein